MPEQDRGTPQAGPGGERPGGGGGSRAGPSAPDEGRTEAALPRAAPGQARVGIETRASAPVPGAAYKAAGKLPGKAALITGGDPASAGPSRCSSPARGPTSPSSTSAERGTPTRPAGRRGGGAPLPAPGRRPHRPGVLPASGRATVQEFGKLDVLVNNAAHQNRKQASRRSRKRMGPDVPDQHLRLLPPGQAALPHLGRAPRSSPPGRDRPDRQQGPARLLGDQGGDQCLHQGAGAEPRREGHPRQRRRARPGLDAAEPRRQRETPRQVAQFGKQDAVWTAGTARGIAPAYVFFASRRRCSSYITGEVVSQLGGQTTAG